MKTLRKIFCIIVCSVLALGFTACENDGDIIDATPIEFTFTVTGPNGEDLLNPNCPGNYSGMNITATYEDKIYEKDVPATNSRVLIVPIKGLLSTQLKNGRHALTFGGLNGHETYKNATITLDWGDRTKDIITFSSKMKGNNPKFNRSFKLNGKEVAKDTPKPTIDIKKEALIIYGGGQNKQ